MNASTHSFKLALQHQGMFSAADAASVDIECRTGQVWITLDGEQQDYVLEVGDHFTTTAHSNLLLYALQPSCIKVTGREQTCAKPRRRSVPTLRLGFGV